ncbi:MAG: hypothetical protein WBB28_02355 [Crinalium sp.]
MPYNTDINDCPDQWRSPEFGRGNPPVVAPIHGNPPVVAPRLMITPINGDRTNQGARTGAAPLQVVYAI